MAYSGKHIFFDLDRTLWDFDKNSERALRILFEECGLAQHIPSFESFQKVYYNKNKALWHAYSIGKISKESLRYERFRSTLKKFQLTDESLIKRFGDGYVDLSPKQTALVPFAEEVISDLKDMGFTLHIITNGFLVSKILMDLLVTIAESRLINEESSFCAETLIEKISDFKKINI